MGFLMNPVGLVVRMLESWKGSGMKPVSNAGIAPHEDLSPHELERSVYEGELLGRIGASRLVEISSDQAHYRTEVAIWEVFKPPLTGSDRLLDRTISLNRLYEMVVIVQEFQFYSPGQNGIAGQC